MKEIVELLEALSYLAAVVGVFLSIHAWRREFLGRRKIELAEEIMATFLEARAAIRGIRNPGSFGHEASGREVELNENPEQGRWRDIAFIVSRRISARAALLDGLNARRYSCIVRFGPEAEMPFIQLWAILAELQVAPGTINLATRQLHLVSPHQGVFDILERCEKIIWDHGEEDVLNPRVDGVIESVNTLLQPLLNPVPVSCAALVLNSWIRMRGCSMELWKLIIKK